MTGHTPRQQASRSTPELSARRLLLVVVAAAWFGTIGVLLGLRFGNLPAGVAFLALGVLVAWFGAARVLLCRRRP